MRLSILILNYKTPQKTIACVDSVIHFLKDKLESNEYEIIVVDNGSENKSFELLQKSFKTKHFIKIISSKKNLGFGNGLNFAQDFAQGEYLLFLNSDILLMDSNAQKIIEYLDTYPHVAIVGGKLVDPENRLQRSAAKFPLFFQVVLFLIGLERFSRIGNDNKVVKVDWVEGSYMVVRKNVFEKAGGFDKHMFMYVEDVELCYRIKQLHYSIVYFPLAVAKHAGQGSSNRSFAIVNIYQGILYFYKKHKSPLEFTLVKLLLQSKALLLVSYGKLIKNTYLSTTYEKALAVC